MNVAEIMSPHLVTVATHTSPDDALQLMDDQDVRHLPVLEGGNLVGIVSDRDLLGATGWHPVNDPARRQAGKPACVRDIMHTTLTVIGPDDPVVTAAVELVVMGIGCLPVLRDGKLVGMVTEMDVLLAFWRAARKQPVESEVEGVLDPDVASKMARHPTTVEEEMPLDRVVELCRSVHVRHLPVMRGGALTGILSDRDLRAALGEGHFSELTVRDVMATECVTTGPQARLSEAAEIMVRNRFSALPVVADVTRLLGILTITDLLDHCMNTLREPQAYSVL